MSGGSHPQDAVRIQVKTGNIIAGQSVPRRLKRNKFPRLEKVQALALRSNPKVSLRIFRQGANDIFRQTVARGEKFPIVSVPSHQAVLRADPQLPGAVFKQRENLAIEDFRAERALKMVRLKLKKPLVARADPDLLFAVHKDSPRIRITANRCEILRGVCDPVRCARAVERHPQAALRIFGHRLHNVRARPFRCLEIFSFDAVQPAAVSSDPQISFAIHAQGKHV